MIYNYIGDYMKKVVVPILFLVSLSIILFVVFTKANINNIPDDEAIKIGEEKYLKFLWMVDGAFNSERYNGDFTVNGKSLDNKDKIFTCTYQKKNNNECIGNNFEEEFNSLFSSNIHYDTVYGDGNVYIWYEYKDGKYIFNNLNNCSINRMDLNHKLEIEKIKENELIFIVNFNNSELNSINNKRFILIKEDDDWKISKAFYYDLCDMKYYIE